MSNIVYLKPRKSARREVEPAVYTVPELAKLLRFDLGTTYEHLRNGLIPARRVGRRWVIPRQRIHKWLEGEEPAEGDQRPPRGGR